MSTPSQTTQTDPEPSGLAGPDFDKYRADDVIVALPHMKMVVKKLKDAGVGVRLVEIAKEVGLARITLVAPQSAAGTLALAVDGDRRVAATAASWPHRRPDNSDEKHDLELILWSLRVLFAADLAGWTPTIGKNRMLGSVHGVGEISHGLPGDITHGGAEDPKPTTQTLAPRLAGPGQGVRVGVLDTGLYPNPWLAGGWVARPSDLLPDVSDARYADGHATFVTGLVLHQAPAATVEVRKVLANGRADSWTVAKEIVRFGRSGLDVLNLSLVGYTGDGQPPMSLAAAVDRLPPDLVVVAAAGNHGAPPDPEDRTAPKDRLMPGWPAALDDVIAVGSATADSDLPGGAKLADFTPDAPWIDLLADGERLVSTYLPKASLPKASKPPYADPVPFPNGFAQWSGTSFSAALISGAIAAATDPGRFPARAALDDLMHAASAGQGAAEGVGSTQAPFVSLRVTRGGTS